MSEKQGNNFTLLNGAIIMKRSIYNPTADAVWLAAYAPTDKVKTILDIGIGTGGVSLCLHHHNENAKITGIDISQDMLDICEKNLALNGIEAELIKADINTYSTTKTFDLVVTNPPYFNGTPAKHNAHHNANITKWVDHSSARVKPGGWYCIIADALVTDKIISELNRKRFGNIQIMPLFSIQDSAERVIIRAKQGVKTGTTIYNGMSMNDERILRSGLTINSLLTTLRRS